MQTRAPPTLLDSAGRPLHLGPQLGSAGEGAVFELRDRSDQVVKLYHKGLEPEKALKIANMAKAANERLLKLTAWPTEPIRLSSGSRAVVGFTMPKIAGHKQAFSLYSPKLRLQEFPKASWQFLIRSAANAARAFAVVHESGHVIGDVNHGNLFVGDRATVRLIDCDSYQITINGSRWFCEVGTATHQPPELQNVRTYKGILRTPNHDNFGLAVIIFQMLFMARHPFSGRFLGSGEMPMERAISEYRFAYGSNAAAMQMQPPPASLGLNGVTRDVALLFERAYSKQGSQASGRPTAREWVTALQDLETHLKKCSVNPAHQFVDSLPKCPWCDIEAATGVLLFQVALVGPTQTGFTIADFWGKVTSVPNPGAAPALPRIEGRTITLSATALELQQATWGAKIASGLFALIGGSTRIHTLKKNVEKKAADARSRWNTLQNNWSSYTSAKDFDELYVQLQNLRVQHEGLPQKRLQALHQLEASRYKLQLHAHLDSCRISHARIKGIGDARKATLQSYGIETAADITEHRVLVVPGFGRVAVTNLRQWREQQERRFRFDPNKGVDQTAKNKVEREILTERIDLERKLNEALSKLTVSSHHVLTRRQTLLAQAEQGAGDLAQAEADLRAASIVSPIVPGKRLVMVLGAISVGGLIIASNQGQRSPPVPAAIPSHAAPSVVTPVAPLRPIAPPHVEVDAKGGRQPEDGYDWSDVNRTTVRWIPGRLSRKNPHAIASDTEGKWEPEDGYDWVNPGRLNDKSTKWTPGTPSSRYPHVVAAPIEDQWRPADGYAWVVNPHRPSDMRVFAITAPPYQIISPPSPPGFTSPPATTPFDKGVADRAEFEQWFASLAGDFRRGADWWAGRRSVSNPGACSGLLRA
jgi:DNA-binding helix-hairpin-helix protein with protein kinase domain